MVKKTLYKVKVSDQFVVADAVSIFNPGDIVEIVEAEYDGIDTIYRFRLLHSTSDIDSWIKHELVVDCMSRIKSDGRSESKYLSKMKKVKRNSKEYGRW